MRPLLILPLALAACSGSDGFTVPDGDDTGPEPTPTPTPTPTPAPTTPTELATLSGVEAALNPTYPTVIRVSWEQSQPASVHVEFSFEDGEWRSSPARDLEPGAHQELILGVPYQYDVTWRIVATNPAGTTTSPDQSIRTADAPSTMPLANLASADPTGWDAAMDYLLIAVTEGGSISSRTWTMLVDRQGRVVWAHRTPQQRNTMHPRVSWTEDSFLIDHSSFFSSFDGGAAGEILELKIDGTEVRRVAAPGHHHPFTDLPDGSIAYTAYRDVSGFGIAGDDVVVVVDPAGIATDLFSCDDFLDDLGERGWCGTNTLSYNPIRDVFLFSIFTHESVLEIDAATGTALKWYGQIPGSYTFNPADSAFWYQHGSVYTDAGTLLVSSHASSNSSELVVREYQVDDTAQQLVQVWTFGQGEGVVGRQMGEAHRLPSGHTLHNHGTHAVVREITPAGQVVWDIRWEDREYNGAQEHAIGRSAPVTQDLWQFAPARP